MNKFLFSLQLIGVLMLTGIVVTNIERNRKEGMPVREPVLNGSLSRIQPILINDSSNNNPYSHEN